MQRLDIAAYRHHFADALTVVKLQDRYYAVGVNALELIAELLTTAQVNLHRVQL